MMDQWVFVDTCVWASFFAKPSSPEKRAVDRLIDQDRVALCGPILAEVLLGFRRKDQADWIGSRLLASHYVELTPTDWRTAADLGRTLAANGHRLPLTDLIVAAIARRLSAAVYSSDPHFDRFEDLRRFLPK